jgi:hypothetical protein
MTRLIAALSIALAFSALAAPSLASADYDHESDHRRPRPRPEPRPDPLYRCSMSVCYAFGRPNDNTWMCEHPVGEWHMEYRSAVGSDRGLLYNELAEGAYVDASTFACEEI